MKLNRIERLARDICWVGFTESYRKQLKQTKAQYWALMPDESRENYRGDARLMMSIVPRLPEGTRQIVLEGHDAS